MANAASSPVANEGGGGDEPPGEAGLAYGVDDQRIVTAKRQTVTSGGTDTVHVTGNVNRRR